MSELNENQKNHNFVMMYCDHMPEVRWLMKKSGIASSILNFIMGHMDNNALSFKPKFSRNLDKYLTPVFNLVFSWTNLLSLL